MRKTYDAATPLDELVKLDLVKEAAGEKEIEPKDYQAIVSLFMYVALATRPNISFAVAALSRYNS
jgi:hypothetical protein